MAVYTSIDDAQAQSLCDALALGQVVRLQGIAGGIENTNYFLHTQREGESVVKRVLTLFERLDATQLPYYLDLMAHLAQGEVAVPEPVAAAKTSGHPLVHHLAGKPASVVSCLDGTSELSPGPEHCALLGHTLARMHQVAASYPQHQPNLRGLAWWNDTVPGLLPHLSEELQQLLVAELAYQNHVASTAAYAALPRAAVHADLFRDNVMFATDAQGQLRLSGVFDFYFAGDDHCLFDLCVACNDWAVDLPTGQWDVPRLQALMSAYERVRPLGRAERQLMPALLRAAALRFWISRLWDWHRPRPAELLKPHDPTHFERILRCRRALDWPAAPAPAAVAPAEVLPA
jgi:homoserine kinase type II